MKKTLLITDNGYQFKRFKELLQTDFQEILGQFDFRRSQTSSRAKMYETGIESFQVVDVKKDWPLIVENYSLVLSLHCKQIFPPQLVNKIRCINIHPGYNPYNRGWYPQVFAIKDRRIIGATIHEMDEGIDSGRIIARKQVPIFPTDTSKEVYERVLDAEIDLLRRHLSQIVDGSYLTISPEEDGVFHTRKQFEELCKLNLESTMTLGEAIDLLRSLTHGEYSNAYFLDEQGKKIKIKINLSEVNNQH